MSTLRSLQSLLLALVTPLAAAADSPVLAPQYNAGDRWAYRQVDMWSDEQMSTFSSVVERVVGMNAYFLETTLSARNVALVGKTTRQGVDIGTLTPLRFRTGGPFVMLDFPLVVGKSWSFEYTTASLGGDVIPHYRRAEIEEWEEVAVPAGTYRALRVVHVDRLMLRAKDGMFPAFIYETIWYAPSVKRYVKKELQMRDVNGKYEWRVREELTGYTLN